MRIFHGLYKLGFRVKLCRIKARKDGEIRSSILSSYFLCLCKWYRRRSSINLLDNNPSWNEGNREELGREIWKKAYCNNSVDIFVRYTFWTILDSSKAKHEEIRYIKISRFIFIYNEQFVRRYARIEIISSLFRFSSNCDDLKLTN